MSDQRVEDHYARSGSGVAIAARILAALRAHAGADVAITPETLAPLDHLHGRGAQATEELVTLLEPRAGEAILDIGSGLGGPARWIATRFGCAMTGVDLTEEHCDAARANSMPPAASRTACGSCRAARSPCRCRTPASTGRTRTTW